MYKSYLRSLFALATSFLLLTGCATITTGTTQIVTVVTEKDVTGASCELLDQAGGTWRVSSTPGEVKVNKGDGPMTVVCHKEGYVDGSILVDEDVTGAAYGNIILGGVIGVAIDAASGAAQRYPDVLNVWMEPEHWGSLEERIAWLKLKRKSYQRSAD